MVGEICAALDKLCHREDQARYQSRIRFVSDRPANDFRYSLNTQKIESELGWKPKTSFHQGIWQTVKWYLEHRDWLFAAAQRLETELLI